MRDGVDAAPVQSTNPTAPPALERPDVAGKTPGRSGAAAAFVAVGILLSRLVGLVRERAIGHYFGDSSASDAWRAAFKIPNLLQNLFGEGALSASFIPVYSRLLAEGDDEEAGRVAGGVLAVLALLVALLVLFGVLATPWLIAIIAPGFAGEKRELTIRLVQVLFPGAGLLVLSAWCLGVLNSHRRFLLSYSAPVAWSLAIIATLVWYGPRTGEAALAVKLAWGSVAGSLLVFLVQLPSVLRLGRHLRVRLDTRSAHVRTVVRNFGPVFVGRGVVQLSAYVDQILASWLPTGAVAALGFAQILYTLPVSLFGMSVSAAELPAMSSAIGTPEETARYLRERLDRGLRQIAFFIVPSSMGFLALGDVIAGAVFQSGRFTHDVTIYVWGILAGSSVGLLAGTLGRLYSSTYYALRDTGTPLRFAIVRVLLTTLLGYLFAFPLVRALGLDARWGAAGLTASAGVAGWVEFALLRRSLGHRIGRTGLRAGYVARLWTAAVLGAGAAWGVKTTAGGSHPAVAAVAILGVYGMVYVAVTLAFGVPEARAALQRFGRVAARARRG